MSSLSPKVIPFPSPKRRLESAKVISQERLRLGRELLEREWAAVRALREFQLTLEKDLSEGAQLAPGELTFDRQLKIVTAGRSEAPATVTGRR
jgi:hypothetical protein